MHDGPADAFVGRPRKDDCQCAPETNPGFGCGFAVSFLDHNGLFLDWFCQDELFA